MKTWTEEEVKYIQDNWNKVRIADMKIDRTYKGIYMKARDLNLGPNRMMQKKTWTEEDIEYLERSWGSTSMVTTAKNLGRTKGSIQQKASELGLGPFLDAGEYISLNQLMNLLRGRNQDTYTVKQWRDKGLPIKNKRVKDTSFKVIYLQDFWNWAQMHSTLINFSKLEPLILGSEPAWLAEQRRADIENNFYKKIPWTKSEDYQLNSLLISYRYTYRELSLKIRRTEGAIKRRMCDLNIKARPLKMSNHNPWTEEETKLLVELYHKGHTPNTMANYITRSSQACSGKVERLIKENVLHPRSEFRASC